jgi:Spy/CpxP family protein refolding chaperone
MKKFLMVLAACTLAFCWASVAQEQPAQQPAHPGHMGQRGPMASPDQQLQHMTQQLNLTSDQQDKIRPILENESKQMQELRQDTSLTRQDRMSKMRGIRENSMSQIKAVLNPDQQQKLLKMGHRGPRKTGEQTPQ